MKYVSSVQVIVILICVITVQNVSAVEKVRIADLFEHPARGQRVVLEGGFVEKVNFETMSFRDESGQIEVIVADGDLLPERITSKEYRVRLQGETDSGYLGAPVLLFESVEVISHDPAYHVMTAATAVEPQVLEADLLKKTICAEHLYGQKSKKTDDISSLLNNRCVGTMVSLVGIFVDQINYETLLFRDQSGEIEVVVTDDDMRLISKQAWVHPIKLRGKLIQGFRQEILIEFESIGILKQG